MREESDYIFGEEETMEIVRKFERMIKHRKNFFFDVFEFENIIDHYLNSDNSKRAAEAVDIAFQIHPYSSEIQLRKAELLVMNEQYSEALKLLIFLIKTDPHNSEVYFLKGQSHLSLGDFIAAEESFNYAAMINPEDKLDLLHRIAGLYQDIAEYSIAIRHLLHAYSIDNESLNINFELGFCYECMGEFAKSEKHYNLYLDENPFSTSVWYNLGIVHTRNGDFDKALEAYDYALAIDPANGSAIHNKANTLATIERYDLAIEEFKELIKYEPENPRLFVSIAECHERLGNYSKAIATYQQSLSLFPANADAYYGIGIVKLKTKQTNLALENISKAIALDPENYDFWLGLAKVKFELKRVDDALDAYKQATILNPEEPDAYIGIAETLLIQEEFAEVEALYEKISEKFSDTYPLKVICAAALYLQNKPQRAIDLLQGAKKLAPTAIDEFFSIVSVINDDNFVKKVKLL